MGSSQVKKNLMFLAGEDFYYFTYSILLTLDCLACKDGRYFRDYRKLPFLIDFVSDENLIYILESSSAITPPGGDGELAPSPPRRLNRLDREYMFKSYTNGIARRSEILKLLFTLERSQYVALEKGDLQSAVNVSLLARNLPSKFLDKDVFENEYKNAEKLRGTIKRLSSLTLSTMLAKIYQDRGVSIWAL